MSTNVVRGNVARLFAVERSFDAASVPATSTAEQAVTVPGVRVGDTVLARQNVPTAGLIVHGARVSAANTVQVNFANITAAAIDAPASTYTFTIIRPERLPLPGVMQP